jgi:hypothetical protein
MQSCHYAVLLSQIPHYYLLVFIFSFFTIIHYSLFIIHCSLFIVHCSLLTSDLPVSKYDILWSGEFFKSHRTPDM